MSAAAQMSDTHKERLLRHQRLQFKKDRVATVHDAGYLTMVLACAALVELYCVRLVQDSWCAVEKRKRSR